MNQFINVAVAEKLAHLKHEEWMRNRKQPSKELAARALILLDKGGSKPVEPGDELQKSYRTKRRRRALAPLTAKRELGYSVKLPTIKVGC